MIKFIKKILTQKLLFLVTFVAFQSVFAAASGDYIFKAQTDIKDTESLRRGADFFVKNCISCHSINRVRYNTIAQELDWSNDELASNFMVFTGEQSIYAYVNSSIPSASLEQAYGQIPPDLSLFARLRGKDYLLSFFNSYYVDPQSPTGMNNSVFPSNTMPNIFTPYQGIQNPIMDSVGNIIGFEQASEGSISNEEFLQVTNDLVNFLDFVAEPTKADRLNLGIPVLIFLFIFIILTFLLYRAYAEKLKHGCSGNGDCGCKNKEKEE